MAASDLPTHNDPTAELPVVEIRVHGVSGTAPESLLATPHVVQVGGDNLGRIFRPADAFDQPTLGKPLAHPGDGTRTHARILEGYHWGRMTSGGWSKAVWALMFPFALANVAYWMLPPRSQVKPSGLKCLNLCRALLRASGYTLTCLLMAQCAVGALDLVANQCAGSSQGCLTAIPHLGWFWHHPEVRSLLTTGGLLLGVFVLNRISSTAWSSSCGEAATAKARDDLAVEAAGASFYTGDPDVPALRALHVIGSLSTAALISLGGPHRPDRGIDLALWIVGWSLVLVAGITVTLMDDPTNAERLRRHEIAQQIALHVGRPLALLLLVVTAAVGPLTLDQPAGIGRNGEPNPLVGSGDAVGGAMIALSVLTFLVALLLIAPARQATHFRASRSAYDAPRPFRPFAGGWFSAPIAALSALLGAGLGLGLTTTASSCLQRSCSPHNTLTGAEGGTLRLPTFYASLTEMWGLTALVMGVVVILGLLLVIGQVLAAWWTTSGLFAPGFLLQNATRPVSRVKVAADWQTARLKLTGGWVLTGIAVAMSAIGTVSLEAQWLGQPNSEPLPDWIGSLIDQPGIRDLTTALDLQHARVFTDLGNIGVYLLDGLALGLLYAVYNAARRPNKARQLGILWDLASYWPRTAHPYVPPCYAQKVVPELVDRIRQYTDAGHRVVLCGHSQGSLVAASALLRLMSVSPDSLQRVGLVTAGSQLQWAYPRGFPSVIDVRAYRILLGALDGRWRSLVRGTDPLGGQVLTWDLHVTHTPAPEGSPDAPGTLSLDAMALTRITSDRVGQPVSDGGVETAAHARIVGAEHWLADPVRPATPYRASPVLRGFLPGKHAHSHYWRDAEWDHAVALAAGLDEPQALTETVEPERSVNMASMAAASTAREKIHP